MYMCNNSIDPNHWKYIDNFCFVQCTSKCIDLYENWEGSYFFWLKGGQSQMQSTVGEAWFYFNSPLWDLLLKKASLSLWHLIWLNMTWAKQEVRWRYYRAIRAVLGGGCGGQIHRVFPTLNPTVTSCLYRNHGDHGPLTFYWRSYFQLFPTLNKAFYFSLTKSFLSLNQRPTILYIYT